MTAVNYAPRASSDILKPVDFLAESDPRIAAETADLIASAVETLRQHPLIGRAVESGYRELVISRGRSGYVALYRYDEVRDDIVVLAIRHQREAGFL
jgi:plasmid stabilization system protein ParE